MLERALDRDMAAGAADDERQLALEVEVLRDRRADQLALMADQGVGETDEHAGLLRQLATGLGGVGAVVDAGAEDLVRIGYRREPSDVGEGVVRLRPIGGLLHIAERAGGERIAQAAIAAADPLVEPDHAV